MHRCLQVTEILLQILDELAPPDRRSAWSSASGEIEQTSLAALARTCQTFYEPAMDVLWEHLTDIDHLLACLPCDYASVAGEDDNLPRDALRFCANARRVRRFKADGMVCRKLAGMLPLLERAAGSNAGLLFPNIQNLSIVLPIRDHLAVSALTGLLLGPKVHTLYISSWPHRHMHTTLLHQVGHTCTHVRNLRVATLPASGFTLAPFVKLVTFHCEDRLSVDASAHLASLPSLQTLKIVPPQSDVSESLHMHDAFPSLNCLTVMCDQDGGDFPSVVPLLRTLSTQSLQCLRIMSPTARYRLANVTQLNDLIRTISLFINLRELRVEVEGTEWVRHCVLYPLRGLRRLQRLVLHLFNVEPALSDTDLPAFGAAWPALTHFELVHHAGLAYGELRPTGLTLGALPMFAAHFPRVRAVKAHLDARDVAALPAPSSRAAAHIRELDLKNSLIGQDPVPVAAYIAAACPGARLVEGEMDEVRDFARYPWGAWRAVEELVNEGPFGKGH
ncbi:hypothetical protein PsYK624_043690 [Phanerochaete sordida]|uniref:F-box domain-containing protein n=1 Tax=Phanerochaete sordida TaxID=48140 RepID=A0A9P3LAD6_9APHY|nr:hypothetical protein PsYK624_043690 [Phanerochaete sordida]